MMGYFPNGSTGSDYEERYCVRCVHDREAKPCAVLMAHYRFNYEECNNDNSILHMLIPLTENHLSNEECRLFWPRGDVDMSQERAGMAADQKYMQWLKDRRNG